MLFTYIMMGEFDQWEDEDCRKLFQPWDYSRVLIPAVASAAVSNILRYTGASPDIVTLGTFLALFFGIVAMGDVLNNAGALKWIGKAFFFLILSILSAGLCELLYVPFLLYGTGESLLTINENLFLNFIFSLPSRFLEYSLLVFLLAHKRSLLKARIIKIIFESKVLVALTIAALLINLYFYLIMYNVVCYEKALVALPAGLRLAAVLGVCLFPVVNLSALVWCIYYLKNSETAKKKAASASLRKIVAEIKAYPEGGNRDHLVWALNGLAVNLEEVADELYSEEQQGPKRR
ncbi:MAG: hypothetical protein QHH10_04100 [Peptococcaceae bacterium]|nr:hypothetical protein [Peptococcaceae bacterium]MDH7524477.1 hypothetical protein [Peptococcaceae bacterium]